MPRTLAIVSEEALGRYPHAMTVKTALRSYTVARELIPPELEPLVKPQLLAIQESVAEAFDVSLDGSKVASRRRVRWESKEMSDWVAGLTEHVNRFEERVETLLYACDKIDMALVKLGKVDYDASRFRAVVDSIQKQVDELNLAGYSDLASWVEVVDDRIAEVLSSRLEGALKEWCDAYLSTPGASNSGDDDDEEEKKDDGTGGDAQPRRPKLRVPTILVEILLRNQEISASPSIPSVREIFLAELHDYMALSPAQRAAASKSLERKLQKTKTELRKHSTICRALCRQKFSHQHTTPLSSMCKRLPPLSAGGSHTRHCGTLE